MSPRRKSVDSSDSSSDSDSSRNSHKHKKHRVKKDKCKKDKKDRHHEYEGGHGFGGSSSHAPLVMPEIPASNVFGQMPVLPHSAKVGGEFHSPPPGPPPAYSTPVQQPPPSGFRVPLATTAAFPNPQQTGQPPCYDADGTSPVFIGSALMDNSVHPCKIGPHLQPFVAVPYGGVEYPHHGRYDLLPFKPDQMEFVPASHGRIPAGRRPIEGGYEENGAKLYHAIGRVNGVRVPGKTGEHLGGCNVSFGGMEHGFQDGYEILCWR